MDSSAASAANLRGVVAAGSATAGRALEGLLARMASGDEGALSALYQATSGRVYGMALRVLADPSEAEEVAIEVYDQAWRQASHYDTAKGSVSAWLATIARTRAIDRRRGRERRARRESALDSDAEPASPLVAPSDASSASEHSAIVRRALDALPIEQRSALEAAFFRGLTHVEVAAALGAPLGTIKTRIRTALANLRLKLAGLEEEIA
jgi:RNA polymerase sigma-70 factor (ECF subfamily)